MTITTLTTRTCALALGVIGAIAIIPTTLAQSIDLSDPTPDENTFQNNEQDGNYGELGNIFNPLDLIHRANLGRSRNAGDFAEDTQTGLNRAAEDFKKLQQQQLQEFSQPTAVPQTNP